MESCGITDEDLCHSGYARSCIVRVAWMPHASR